MAVRSGIDKNSETIENYRPTPYKEEVWPVISEKQEEIEFRPAQFEKIVEGEFAVDAMFADFSKLPKGVIELDRDAGDFNLSPADNSEESLEGVQPESAFSNPSNEEIVQFQDNTKEINSRVVSTEIEPFESPSLRESLAAESAPEEAPKVSASNDLSISEEKLAEALEQAYERGRIDAVGQVQQIQRQLEERYSLLWEDMQTQLTEAASSYEMKSVELAMLVAKRLVGDVVETKREYIIEIIKEAMRAASDSKVVEIRVSPEDYEFLKLGSYGDKDKIISGESLNFTRDESIRSGCILTTSRGAIDLDLDKAWERIKDKILREPQP